MPVTMDVAVNFGISTLLGGAGGANTLLLPSDATLLVQPGDGAKYVGGPGSKLLLGTLAGAHEICVVTGVSTDTLFLTRGGAGAEGTLPQTWSPGTPVQQSFTAGNITNLQTAINSGRVFNVKDNTYGAKGDGVTDDTAALQAATEAARLAGGGTVYLPGGAPYIVHLTVNPNVAGVSAALHLGSNVTLAGDGPGATILKLGNNQAVDQQRMISNWNPQSTGTDHTIRVRDLTINGNAAGQSGVPLVDITDGLHLRYVRDVLITNVIGKNNLGTTNGPNGPGGTGGESRNLLCWFCADVSYQNCEAFSDDGGGTSGGIGAYNCFNVHMDACTVHDMVYSWGFAIFECTTFEQTNCTAYNCLAGPAFLVEVSNQGTLAACQGGALVGQYGPAATLAASTHLPCTYGFEVFGCSNVILLNCISLYASVSAFSITDSTIPAVTENNITCVGCQAAFATNHGFAASGAGYDFTFVGCTAFNNTSRGFLIQTTGTIGQNKLVGCRSINNGTGYQIDAAALPYTNMVGCEELGNTTHLSFGGVTYTKSQGALTAPAFPATTVALANPYPFGVTIHILGGTVTHVTVDGTDVATATSATLPVTTRLPAGKSITLTYSVVPTSWVWVGD